MATAKKYTYSDTTDPTTGTRYIVPTAVSTSNSSSNSNSSNSGNTYYNTATSSGTYPSSNVTSGTKTNTSGSSGYSYPSFSTSSRTNSYASKLDDYEDEDNKPTWSSKYEGTISNILNNILNRESFSLDTDANYNQLYNNYAERYKANANRAMNDTLASANAATGGYGSTYGQAVAQQAYDQTMEGLNDQNLALAQLAYQMYGDETADNYNQLSAVTGLDNTDYSRYRDDVSDYYTDRDYYANQYNNSYSNDYNQWANDRDFDYGTYTNDRNYDYQEYSDALNLASQYATSGMTVPTYLTDVIAKYTGQSSDSVTSQFAQTVAQALAGSGSSGRSGSGGSSSSKGTTQSDGIINVNTAVDIADNEDSETAVEALDEAYLNYYKGVIASSSAQGKAQALQQIINKYIQVTGDSNASAIAHFKSLLNKNGQKQTSGYAVTGLKTQ